MSNIMSRTYNNNIWKQLPLTAKFERVVNEYIRLECHPIDGTEEEGQDLDRTYATYGLKKWWYSPSKDFFWPHNPYLDGRAYLNAHDWIYVAKTLDGQIDWLDHGTYNLNTDVEEHFRDENDDYPII